MNTPSKVIDFGCGAGNYAIYLASRGFDVTGIDGSPAAIQLAREKAEKIGVKCRFHVADVLEEIDYSQRDFDFAYDWSLLHHIMPVDRKKYIANVHRVLKPSGKYLSVCFSEDDTYFGGKGKIRKTPVGTTLYFSSENELKELFSKYFKILHIKTINIPGKRDPHRAVCVWMKKSED